MGLLEELDFVVKPPNVAQRAVQRLASSRPGAWALQKTLHPMDRALFRVTDGRVTVPGLMAGLPVVMLTTTGARTGRTRTMPLVGIPLEGELAVIGSNFGQRATPGWVYNLEANPDGIVSYGGRSIPVRASVATGEQAEEAFRLGSTVYPGYDRYRERVEGRAIRVFVLSPAERRRP